MRKIIIGLIALGLAGPCIAAESTPPPTADEREAAVLHQVQLLNQIAEDQLSDKNDPGLSIIKTIYDLDAPDFVTLQKVLWKSNVRASLTPGAKAVLAGIISQRWDTFALSGNLWLGALRSSNAEFRDKARQRLVAFIQAPHIPVLIDMLRLPGTSQAAYEVLKEVSGQTIELNMKKWQAWWAKTGGKADLVGHLLKDTQQQIQQHPIAGIDQNRFWYLPEGVKEAQQAFARRSKAEQDQVMRWNEWIAADVGSYLEEWSIVKPVLDRLIHQPDLRVSQYFEQLTADSGMGDYAGIVIAWRGGEASLPALQASYQRFPTAGRALGRGSLGDKNALRDLLSLLEKANAPLTFYLMDDAAHAYAQTLHTVGVLPAEQAFELLVHHAFDLQNVNTRREKKKAVQKAQKWLDKNWATLTFDPHRRYYVASSSKP